MLRPCWEVRSDGSGRGEDLSLVTVRGEGPGRARTMLARAEVTTEGTLEPGGPCGAVAGDRGGWALCLHMDRSLAANSLQERGGVGQLPLERRRDSARSPPWPTAQHCHSRP